MFKQDDPFRKKLLPVILYNRLVKGFSEGFAAIIHFMLNAEKDSYRVFRFITVGHMPGMPLQVVRSWSLAISCRCHTGQ